MSRSGYSDECENNWAMICYRGAVNSAIKGKRGQAFLIEMLAALDAMPVKELVSDELENEGSYCALGVVGKNRGIKLAELDPDNSEQVAKAFGISDALAREIVFENDDAGWWDETPAQRWQRVRRWIDSQIIKNPVASA